MEHNSAVVAFSGSLGSGKTALSSEVATALQWPRAAFGDYVRLIASQREIGHTRVELQALGERLLNEGTEKFCRNFLRYADWQSGSPLIIDGIRHHEVAMELRRQVLPLPLLWIFISTDTTVQYMRVKARDNMQADEMHGLVLHSTEVQVQTLMPHLADLVVDGQRPTLELCNEVIAWVRSELGGSQ